MPPAKDRDETYVRVLLEPVRKCVTYKPKFGKEGKDTSLEEFRALYGADLVFASNAANRDFLPVVAIVSRQVSETVIRRYRSARMLVLLGSLREPDVESTFTFCKNVVGYDLSAFFERNSGKLRAEFSKILRGLLSAG